ncbi:MAG: TetR/AcrR family transcriptional regulator [Clostridia bacterium]|nr:TetR/AcrR family transcriptional regulator [Clostridia bacterium]
MKKGDITKEKILIAAENIFSEKGFAGARVDEIAEISGVNKRLIYAHFGSKENLYKNVLHRVYGRLVEMESSQNMDLPADEVLKENISNAFEFLSSNPNFISLVMHENLSKAKHVDSSGIVPLKSQSIVALQKVLKRGIDDGIFKKDIDINEIVFAVNMFAFAYFSNTYTMPKLIEIDLNDADARKRRSAMVADMIVGYLKNK